MLPMALLLCLTLINCFRLVAGGRGDLGRNRKPRIRDVRSSFAQKVYTFSKIERNFLASNLSIGIHKIKELSGSCV